MIDILVFYFEKNRLYLPQAVYVLHDISKTFCVLDNDKTGFIITDKHILQIPFANGLELKYFIRYFISYNYF